MAIANPLSKNFLSIVNPVLKHLLMPHSYRQLCSEIYLFCHSCRQPFRSKLTFVSQLSSTLWFENLLSHNSNRQLLAQNLYLCHSYRQPLVQNYFCRIVIVYSVFIHKLTFVSQLSSTFWFKYLLMCHSYCQSLIQKLYFASKLSSTLGPKLSFVSELSSTLGPITYFCIIAVVNFCSKKYFWIIAIVKPWFKNLLLCRSYRHPFRSKLTFLS